MLCWTPEHLLMLPERVTPPGPIGRPRTRAFYDQSYTTQLIQYNSNDRSANNRGFVPPNWPKISAKFWKSSKNHWNRTYPILSRIWCTLRCNWSYFNDFLNPKSCVLRLNYFEIFAKIRSLRKSGDATVVILKSNQVHVGLHQRYKFLGPTPTQFFAIASEARFLGGKDPAKNLKIS